jgi:hypothetical protein
MKHMMNTETCETQTWTSITVCRLGKKLIEEVLGGEEGTVNVYYKR